MKYIENPTNFFWQINQKNGHLTMHQEANQLVINYSSIDNVKEVYKLGLEHFDKLVSYKRIAHVLMYCLNILNGTPELAEPDPRDLDSDTPCSAPVPVTQERSIFLKSNQQPIEQQYTLFCEVETTGLGHNDEVIEIAIVDIHENVLLDTLVKPQNAQITDEAYKVHGITHDMLESSPTFPDLIPFLKNLLKNKALVFYNAEFYTGKISKSASLPICSMPFHFLLPKTDVYCLMKYYTRFRSLRRRRSLVSACEHEQIPINSLANHSAKGDAIKACRLYKRLIAEPPPY